MKIAVVQPFTNTRHLIALSVFARRHGHELVFLPYSSFSMARHIFKATVYRRGLRDSVLTAWSAAGGGLRRAIGSADIVVVGMEPYDPHLARIQALAKGKPTILFTSWSDWLTGGPRRRPGQQARDSWLGVAATTFSGVAAVTAAAQKSAVEALGADEVPSSVVHHAVPEQFFATALRSPPRPPVVGFVGRLNRHKAPDRVVPFSRALSAHLGCRVTARVVGSGPGGRSLASRHVELLGHVASRSVLSREMSGWSLLVVPTRRVGLDQEQFGMAIAEALACGVPVLASDHEGPRGILDDGQLGFVVQDWSSEAAMLRAAQLLKSDGFEARRFRRQVAWERYAPSRLADRWAHLVDAVLQFHVV